MAKNTQQTLRRKKLIIFLTKRAVMVKYYIISTDKNLNTARQLLHFSVPAMCSKKSFVFHWCKIVCKVKWDTQRPLICIWIFEDLVKAGKFMFQNSNACRYLYKYLPLPYGSLPNGSWPAAPTPAPLCCMVCFRCNMASCGDIGGNGTPLFGGRPGLELRSENKLFLIKLAGELVRKTCQLVLVA